MPTNKEANLVWIDLEMSGLNPEIDTILEIATVITDSELNTIAIGPELVINQEASLFDQMDDWNRKQHTKSGLWQKVLESNTSLDDAELTSLNFIIEHTVPNKSLLCGNTVYQDRRFLNKYMAKIDDHLHYRLIDVSTIKELAARWFPNVPPHQKKNNHRALDDILESIAELKYYRQHIFIATTP